MRKVVFYVSAAMAVGLTLLFLWFPFGPSKAANDRRQDSQITRTRPANYDILAEAPKRAAASTVSIAGGRDLQIEQRFDVPTFLWSTEPGNSGGTVSGSAAERQTKEIAAARAHLSRYADSYRLTRNDLTSLRAGAVHDTGTGGIIVKFKQDIGGLEVFRDEVNVMMNRDLQLIAISGFVTGADTADQSAVANFQLSPEAALSAALSDLTGQTVDSTSVQRVVPVTAPTRKVPSRSAAPAAVQAPADPYLHFNVNKAGLSGFTPSEEASRTRPMIFHLPDRYVPAYYVETSVLVPNTASNIINASGETGSEEWGYGYVVSAADGQILFRKNQVAEQTSTYRVWADPTTKVPYDTPAGNDVHPKLIAAPDGAQSTFVAQQDVTLQSFPFSHNDPWLAGGATETNGNNVDAFLNIFSPDGFGNPTTTVPTDIPTGDYRAQATGANAFQHSFTAGADTSKAEARQAAIQQMFYNVNFLHDLFYDAGFDEASGNAQTSNFGRGGLEADNIKAQAQDFSGFSNANMLTPADGQRPRMRMYVFPSLSNVLDVQSTPTAAGKRNIGISMSGPQSFDITTDIVKATFTAGPTTCTVTNAAALAGKIALFDFDNTDGTACSFSTRIARLTTTTTASAILMDYQQSTPTTIASITGFVAANTTPVAVISWNGAATIKSELLAAQTVTAHLVRVPDRDGTLDNQVMFHEWGHYISNRLVGNGAGLETNLSGGLGEGWGDFNAMLALTVRQDDIATPSNATWNGAYALATYATSGVDINGVGNNGYYFGIRRVPYSTDMTLDPLTYRHIVNGQTISGAPIAFGANGASNSEVHNTGEVWATMLWECYASLLRDTQGATPRLTFAQAQDRMRRYMVASYKMTPSQPTLLEGRDAVLAAALANDPADFSLFGQAFAKRGAGAGAISPPDRFTTTNAGAVESFALAGSLAFVDASLDDSIVSHDNDGYLDDEETGLLTVRLRNTGVVALTATTAQISCDDPGVTFPSGNSANFASIPAFGTATATVPVHISGRSGLETATFTISSNDSSLSSVAVVGSYKTYVYANEVPASSRTDAVEGRINPWTISTNPGSFFNDTPDSRFRRQPSASGFQWFVPDYFAASDEFLTSPVMTVDGSGSLNVQFDHTFGFEFSGTSFFDGGVVEMSVNGGAWTDIDQTIYPGTVIAGSINPLTGRKAFIKTGSGHVSATAAIAPGSTVQIRFQQGSDDNTGAAGWTIDNIAVSGIVETPFSTVVADTGSVVPNTTALGRVQTTTGAAIPGAVVTISDGVGFSQTAITNVFGYFQFINVPKFRTYSFQASARRYTFLPIAQSVGSVPLTPSTLHISAQ